MREVSRRGFLAALGVGAAAACSDDSTGDADALRRALASTTTEPPTTTAPEAPLLPGNPFTLGVASGDPLHDRVILWTRLATEPHAGGGMGPDDVPVIWEVSTDETFAELAASGIATATEAHGHSVHADAIGLAPDSWYSYRFRVGEHVSPIGRTRTLPAADATPDQLRLGFASCQHWEDGYYNAWRDVAATELDLIVFLGDYIYENGPQEPGPTIVRQHDSPEVTDVVGYRNRYALYRSDPLLRAAHQTCPWIVGWDDHEVDNDYAGEHSQREGIDVTREQFLVRRAAAYQAWWEHMPVRLDPPDGPDLRIHRSFRYGTLASLFLLDTRQYRDDQPCAGSGLNTEEPCAELTEESRTMVGDDQERWLLDGLDASGTTWNVLGNQTVMTPIQVNGVVLNYDQWDGYPASRARILDHLAEREMVNTVVLTGDIHLAGVGGLTSTASGDIPTLIATELVGTSISSDADLPKGVGDAVVAAVPDIQYFNADHRGWCRCVVTPELWTAEFRAVADNRVDGSPVSVDATFEISPDTPGARRV